MNKILIIDNDFDTMSLLKTLLEKKNYVVKFTKNANSVPQLLKEFSPHLVIIDVLQRNVAEKLRTYPVHNHFKILLMTGYTLRSQKNLLPVDDTIEKPFHLPVLFRKIHFLIGKKSEITALNNIKNDLNSDNS